ncbi:MAG: D-alanyl-D-alanine carboxypeptidase family protein, partial [Thermomicrobiales bacterium]
SLTKIATAILVVHLAPDVSQLVTIDPVDVLDASDGQSMMALLAGDVISIHDLLYGLLLNSGNDAATTLARYLGQQLLDAEGASGDPVQRFMGELNSYLAGLGLSDTHFVNPHGLYDPDHYSTAHDMAIMAGALLENDLLATIVSTPEITVTSTLGNAYTLQNTNRLLGEPGITGMKTGTLPESGACLVASKKGPAGTSIVTVLLGSEIQFSVEGVQDATTDKRFADAQTIFTSVESDYAWVSPTSDAELPGLESELAVWQVAMTDDDPVVVRSSQVSSLRYVLRLGPPVAANETAGELLLYDGSSLIESRPVIQIDQTA